MTNILNGNILFADMSDSDLKSMLDCLGAYTRKYDKNDIIFLAGDKVTNFGIILFGNVNIIKEDFMGNRNILTTLSANDLFGEAFAYSETKISSVTAVTASKCEVLFIKFDKIINSCPNACSLHTKIIGNMLKVLANKNILLNNKLEITSAKTTRDKLMKYFSMQISRSGKNKFTIPFNRDGLADFINVNRSSMSRELCKMRDEGILKFDKNKFEILI